MLARSFLCRRTTFLCNRNFPIGPLGVTLPCENFRARIQRPRLYCRRSFPREPPRHRRKTSQMRITRRSVSLVLSLLAFAILFSSNICAVAQRTPALIRTRWKLISLSERPFLHMAFKSYFTLKPIRPTGASGELVDASTDGCNELRGTYESSGKSLRFEALKTSGVFCLPSVPIKTPTATYQSDLFLKALQDTQSFRMFGSTLQLLDQKGRVLARFKATIRNRSRT